jgi:hypothetical protein
MRAIFMALATLLISSPAFSSDENTEQELSKCVNNYEVFRKLQKEISNIDAEIDGLYNSYTAIIRVRERSKHLGQPYVETDAQLQLLIVEIMELVSKRSMKYNRVADAEITLTLCHEMVFKKKIIQKFCKSNDNQQKFWCQERF